MSKIHKKFPSQSAFINEMIQEFQTIWDSKFQKLIQTINKCNSKENCDFNEFYNQKISQKVEIQKYKI